MYEVKPTTKKKQKGYGVFKNGQLVNDWVYETKEKAEKKAKILRSWYEHS